MNMFLILECCSLFFFFFLMKYKALIKPVCRVVKQSSLGCVCVKSASEQTTCKPQTRKHWICLTSLMLVCLVPLLILSHCPHIVFVFERNIANTQPGTCLNNADAEYLCLLSGCGFICSV